MTQTRTHVFYFDDLDLKPLRDALDKLNEDLDSRKEFMTDRAYRAASDRLAAIGLMANVCEEPVPVMYGG